MIRNGIPQASQVVVAQQGRLDGAWYRWLRDLSSVALSNPFVTSYLSRTMTIVTGDSAVMTKRMQLTGSDRMTLNGTARLRIT